jgi:hypothetical protein
MRPFAVFLLILISSLFFDSSACGPYYPMGDDIRFTILKPGIFRYPGFIRFSYSADLLYSPDMNGDILPRDNSNDENIELWQKRCKNIPDYDDTYDAVYTRGEGSFSHVSNNTFIRYLLDNNDTEAIKYLIFAKRCSPFNSVIDDPWERNEHANLPQRVKLISQALESAKTTSDRELQLRYAFLAIRLAYYNEDFKTIKSVYSEYFASRRSRNIVDYWGMYFMVFAETDSVTRNYFASQVFNFAPDKRQHVLRFYDKSVPIDKTLGLAVTNEEKVAVWMTDCFRKTGKSIEDLKILYSLKPGTQGLTFLLLREVNKLEDWIYTPYYTCFNPSLAEVDYESVAWPAARISEDRAYAKDLLNFVNSADLRSVENPELWKIIQAYLNYMTLDYAMAIEQINRLQSGKVSDPGIMRQLNIIKALCLAASQKENPVIADEIKPLIKSEFAAGNNKFIFALARELEYKGNTSDAAALLSKLRTRTDNQQNEGYWRNGIYWRSGVVHHTLFVDYYDDYFFYLDAQYTASQVSDLINSSAANNNQDEFGRWLYTEIKTDEPRLYDLLGTKYMRKNDLNSAYRSYSKVNDTLWTSKHYPFSRYLNANPFYSNMFSEHEKTKADTVSYNKKELVLKLIEYLSMAENKSLGNRAYYCFLVANCYYNMTEYGNSWIMKRYFWTSYLHNTKLEDDDDYFNCRLAREYYMKAKELSRSKQFAALCLRMAVKCEDCSIRFAYDWRHRDEKAPENLSYNELKKEYPDYADELLGNCESFEKYFTSRN